MRSKAGKYDGPHPKWPFYSSVRLFITFSSSSSSFLLSCRVQRRYYYTDRPKAQSPPITSHCVILLSSQIVNSWTPPPPGPGLISFIFLNNKYFHLLWSACVCNFPLSPSLWIYLFTSSSSTSSRVGCISFRSCCCSSSPTVSCLCVVLLSPTHSFSYSMLKHKEAFPLERAFLPFHIRQFHHQPTNQPIHLPPVGPSPPISIPCSPFAAPSPLLLYNILSANFMTQFPPLNSINFFLLHSLTHSPSDPRVISYSTPTTTNQSVSVVTSSFIPPVTDHHHHHQQ